MQAILTRYLCATNHRGARIKASCEAGSITIDYPHELSGEAVHRAAADALCAKLKARNVAKYGISSKRDAWLGPMVGGQLPSGDYAFIFTE